MSEHYIVLSSVSEARVGRIGIGLTFGEYLSLANLIMKH